jgi:hypothetical protein
MRGGKVDIMSGFFLLITAGLVSAFSFSCGKMPGLEQQMTEDGWCSVSLVAGNTATGLGPQDLNTGYLGFTTPAREGERVIYRGKFPHCRYSSMVIYDEDLMPIDSLRDYEILPSEGVNPFVPGTPRDEEYLGEFEVQVLMDEPPEGERPANTLYAGVAHDGSRNNTMIFGFRVYLQDEGYGFDDGHPLAVYGGVEPPAYRVYDSEGNPYCPGRCLARIKSFKAFAKTIWRSRKMIADPGRGAGELTDPPVWYNSASRESQRELGYVPNDDTNYIMLRISDEFGELLVLRWNAARTPMETYEGKPFRDDVDMRYWSLSFAKMDRSRVDMIYTEKTVADIHVPFLPDNSRQIVIGFSGMERPGVVPEDQWVGLEMNHGIIIMRNILVNPEYPGLFWNLPAGDIPPEYDQYTPGGVYCSIEEFKNNPDIGLRRKIILNNTDSR